MLLSAQAKTHLTQLFDQFGAQSQSLLKAFMDAVRHSLDLAIGDVFLLATIVSGVGFVVVLFLREEPLRRTHDAEGGREAAPAEPAVGDLTDHRDGWSPRQVPKNHGHLAAKAARGAG